MRITLTISEDEKREKTTTKQTQPPALIRRRYIFVQAVIH